MSAREDERAGMAYQGAAGITRHQAYAAPFSYSHPVRPEQNEGGEGGGRTWGSGLCGAAVASCGAGVGPGVYMEGWLSLMAGPLGLRMPLPLPQQHLTAGTQTHPQAAE